MLELKFMFVAEAQFVPYQSHNGNAPQPCKYFDRYEIVQTGMIMT